MNVLRQEGEGRTMKQAEQFQTQAKAHNITRWHTYDCSICDYPCGYLFVGDDVGYDSGCDCTGREMVYWSSWQEVADHYNMQTHPKAIAEMDAFWHFDEVKVQT